MESDDELYLITISMPGELGRQSALVVSLYCKHNQTGAPCAIEPGQSPLTLMLAVRRERRQTREIEMAESNEDCDFEMIDRSITTARLNIEAAKSHLIDIVKNSPDGETRERFQSITDKLFDISRDINAMILAGDIREPGAKPP